MKNRSQFKPAKELVVVRVFLMLLFYMPCIVLAQTTPSRIGFSDAYPTSFKDWTKAYLSGNGKMGIMVFGDPLNETVVFNDRNFNLAKSKDRSFATVSAADLKLIKEYCAAGKFEEANKLAVTSSHWQDGGEGNRHPGFKMQITMASHGAVKNYSRSCNFRTGEIIIKWTDNDGKWERRSFVSRYDNVVVQYLTAPAGKKINCSIKLDTDSGMNFPKEMTFTNHVAPDGLNFRAKYPPNTHGAGYEGVVKVVADGGTTSRQKDFVQIINAKTVVMLSRTAKYYDSCETQWNKKQLQKELRKIKPDYTALLNKQKTTHQKIYDRVSLNLNASVTDRALTNERLLEMQKQAQQPVLALWERIFDAGRYLYLSSSSEQSPPDLLGIWTGDCNAGWGGYYHLDANLNLQVSGGNIGNMPEAMEGYFRLNEAWRKDFQTNAKQLLGARGMLAAGNTPGATSGLMASINNDYPYQYATGEEAWLLYPFWEHYQVTGDKKFLRERLYPLLKDMGEFYEDFLIHTDSNGKYIFAGSVSPENQPANRRVSLLNNSNFDIAGAKFVLASLIETCKTLGIEQGPGQGAGRWSKIYNMLPPYLINTGGALQEWAWPGLADNYNHRHSSQLLMVWPFQEITAEKDSILFKAAKQTLFEKDKYSYENAGHGLLHSALIATRLKNAASLKNKLMRFVREDFYYSNLCSSHYKDHGVFCTDVCNTVPTILMEMLVSSEPHSLEVLPALIEEVPTGTIKGLKGRNRITIERLSWDTRQHKLQMVLKSDIEQDVTLIKRTGISSLVTGTKTGTSKLGAMARVVHLTKNASIPVNIIYN